MSATLMARKTTAKAKPPEPTRRAGVLTIKGTPEWKEWLDGLSDHLRMPTSTIVDHALIDFARAKGYKPEAPRR